MIFEMIKKGKESGGMILPEMTVLKSEIVRYSKSSPVTKYIDYNGEKNVVILIFADFGNNGTVSITSKPSNAVLNYNIRSNNSLIYIPEFNSGSVVIKFMMQSSYSSTVKGGYVVLAFDDYVNYKVVTGTSPNIPVCKDALVFINGSSNPYFTMNNDSGETEYVEHIRKPLTVETGAKLDLCYFKDVEKEITPNTSDHIMLVKR